MRIALSEQEHAVMAAAAASEGLALGAFVAQASLAAAQGRVVSEYAVLREALAAVLLAAGQVQRVGVNLNQAVAALNSGELVEQLRWYAQAAARAIERLDDLAQELRHRLP
ncbi:hypothetical protein [Actinomadura violacea]|uniref:Uncharacterized protein n=1 Tax=Actinomadura violacea TaxID=2819934 RepID=A0ABS3S110_9ACTN|nr:hypothetical protein [Actinomadura violacea]MBO2462694.1 hypothetical protein [Actinomadura violacea]